MSMSYSEPVDKLLKLGAKSLGEKDYEKAVEAYGEACELHQEETGKIEPDLFLLYGKSLYESGVSQSDVLGGQEITSEKIEEAKGDEEGEGNDEGDANFQFNDLAAEEYEESKEDQEDEDEDGPQQQEEEDDEEEQEEQEEDGEEGEGEPEEENKTDMELAWDILEVARGLYEERIENDKDSKSKLTIPYLKSDKDIATSDYVKTLKLLSEVYDLLGEVSLESEHFQQAANDLEKCLNMRKELYDNEYSGLIGESHFKLSLALEFCLDDDNAKDKARNHIKSAIQILKNDSKKNPEKEENNKDIIESLQERYNEIENNAEDVINQQKQDMLEGILGSSNGAEFINKLSGVGPSSSSSSSTASSSNTKTSNTKTSTVSAPGIATSKVNDLTSMVKKRKNKPSNDSSKRHKS